MTAFEEKNSKLGTKNIKFLVYEIIIFKNNDLLVFTYIELIKISFFARMNHKTTRAVGIVRWCFFLNIFKTV